MAYISERVDAFIMSRKHEDEDEQITQSMYFSE